MGLEKFDKDFMPGAESEQEHIERLDRVSREMDKDMAEKNARANKNTESKDQVNTDIVDSTVSMMSATQDEDLKQKILDQLSNSRTINEATVTEIKRRLEEDSGKTD